MLPAGQKMLVVRAGKEPISTVLEIWEGSRVVAELQVPAKLHGSIFNDGWFSSGAAWVKSENRVAYVAEVGVNWTCQTDTINKACNCCLMSHVSYQACVHLDEEILLMKDMRCICNMQPERWWAIEM